MAPGAPKADETQHYGGRNDDLRFWRYGTGHLGRSFHAPRCNRSPPTYRRSSNGTQTAIVQVLMLKSADVSAGHIWAIRVQSRTNQGKAAPHRRETHLGRVPTSKMLSSPV